MLLQSPATPGYADSVASQIEELRLPFMLLLLSPNHGGRRL
jgi:hypothetical protein